MKGELAAIVGRLTLLLAMAGASLGQSDAFQVLHSFGGPGDGIGPSSGMIFDKQGNAYGETLGGGNTSCTGGCGLVYELSPQKNGSWVETILYEFAGGSEGEEPNGGLAMDATGKLYGVTEFGGASASGTMFKLAPSSSGWIVTILHSFCTPPDCADGYAPRFGPVLDPAGNLYATAGQHQGVAYELTPGPSGWTETVLYTFCSQPNCTDGDFPSGVVRDSAGNLYGTAREGGAFGYGALFTLRSTPEGAWKYVLLHSFRGGSDGVYPDTVVPNGKALYGLTDQGGGSRLCTLGCGTIFELTASPAGGPPVETVLHRFAPAAEGQFPQGSLAFDGAGNLYGATGYGGAICGCGVVFEMTPGAGGTWQYQIIHDFDDQDGVLPQYGVIYHGGHLFGTTLGGGQYGVGVIYEISGASATN